MYRDIRMDIKKGEGKVWIVTANSIHELDALMESRPDAVILAWPELSLRQNVIFGRSEMAAVIKKLHARGIAVYINALKMAMEQDLPAVEELMQFCAEHTVDGIYIADEGYIPAARRYHLTDRLIYQPETLIVNAMDARFYTDLGLMAVCLAHELSLSQVKAIAAEANQLEVLVQGQYSWMYSRRPLIENYLQEIHREYHPEAAFELRENTRSDFMPIEQGEYGTVVYAASPIESLEVIQELKNCGISRFRIDTYLEDEMYGVRQLELYRKALDCEDPADFAQKAREQGRTAGTSATWSMHTALRKENKNEEN